MVMSIIVGDDSLIRDGTAAKNDDVVDYRHRFKIFIYSLIRLKFIKM